MVLMNLFAGKEWRCQNREWTCAHIRGRSERAEWRKEHQHISTVTYRADSRWGAAGNTGSPAWLTRDKEITVAALSSVVWQKPTQPHKAIFLQLKNKPRKTYSLLFQYLLSGLSTLSSPILAHQELGWNTLLKFPSGAPVAEPVPSSSF